VRQARLRKLVDRAQCLALLRDLTRASGEEVCHYITQPLVELYGGCMVVLKVS
jgi:hypothetical protein